jgi:hypothetical protein
MTKKLLQILAVISMSFTFCLFSLPLSQANDLPCTNGDCIPDPPACTNGGCIPPIPECTNGDCIPETDPCTNGYCQPDEGCTRSPGYWKTHSVYGPSNEDPVWGKLCQNNGFCDLVDIYFEILWTPASSGPYYILAHQYAAAQLNILNRAPMTEVIENAFSLAGGWLVKWSPEQMLSAPPSYREEIINLAMSLSDYNNGFIGPGACSDD